MADKRGGLLSVPQMYQEYVGRPTASLLGGAALGVGGGLLGYDYLSDR